MSVARRIAGFLVGVTAYAVASGAERPEVKTLRLGTVPGLTRAELRYLGDPKTAKGVLLLCPGCNGDGAALFSAPWLELAARHNLAPVGLSFASHDEDFSRDRRRGYFYVENGSGAALDAGLKKLTGKDRTPLVIFGFSYGGQFAHRFTYRNPTRVRVWCAYGTDISDEPLPKQGLPPGIFACGLDDTNLPYWLDAFLSARRAKAPVCWLGVPKTGHVLDEAAMDWVRAYFDAELSRKPDDPEVWREGCDRGLDGFLVKCRFPSESCAQRWDAFGKTPPPEKPATITGRP